ncbi:MAG: L,D-transpeptidase family protein [Bacteroidota bacterium]
MRAPVRLSRPCVFARGLALALLLSPVATPTAWATSPVSASPVSASPVSTSPVSEVLRSRIGGDTAPHVRVGNQAMPVHPDLAPFYAGRDYAEAWVTHPRGGAMAQDLLATLAESRYDGLRPDAYHLPRLEPLVADWPLDPTGADAERAADLDLLLTDAFLRFGHDLLGRRIDPHALYGDDWFPTPRSEDLRAHLTDAVGSAQVRGTLDRLYPSHPAYWRLRDELKRQHALADAMGSWPTILPIRTLLPGESSTQVPALRRQLVLLGDYDADLDDAEAMASEYYEYEMQPAVERFQARNGFDVTGRVNQATRTALNRPPGDNIPLLEANLERWRWLPVNLGATHIMVNAPAYRLRVEENGREALAMNVVVGNLGWKTPMFSDTLTEVIFQPTWGVPSSIAADETIPRVRARGASYLTSRGYKVYDRRTGARIDPATVDWSQATASRYRFIQRPGRANPLGEVKFRFPNPHGIYLHDTNSRSLFNREARAFSHGCIRLADPGSLAKYLLAPYNNWDDAKVDAALAGGPTTGATLDTGIPIHLVYFTAWAGPDGLQVYDDVYGHDEKLIATLNALDQPLAGR